MSELPCDDSEVEIIGYGCIDFPDFKLPNIVSLMK